MIAKRIQRKRETQAKSDKGIFAYVINEKGKGRGDPLTWALADYAVDAAHGGEKVESVRITNCASDEIGWAVKEILATQAQNTRSKTDKSYHLVISFPEGERPSPDQLIDIENEAVRAIGLQDHQRISAVHINTDHYHLHVAINKVHPTSFRNVEPWYDKYRLQDVCVELEKKHNLTRDNHVETPEHVAGKVADMEVHAGKTTFVRWAQETAAEAIVEAAKTGNSWADMHAALAQFDIEIRPRGAGLVIVHRQDDRWRIKASDVAKGVAFKALTDRWGPYKPPAAPDRPTAPEPMMGPDLSDADVQTGAGGPALGEDAPAGQEGLSATTQAAPPAPLRRAKPQGGGPPRLPQPPAPCPIPAPAPRPYAPAPRQRGPAVNDLWQRYQTERQEAERLRAGAVAVLKARHVAFGTDLKAFFANRIKAAKAAKLSKANLLASYQHIAAERMKAFTSTVERERRERQEVRAAHPVVSWQDWLQREAALGDVPALEALRSLARKRTPIAQQIIMASDHAEAINVIHAHMKPFVGRNGDVFYSIRDGGSVVDSPKYILVSNITPGSITLAIELAMRKYEGRDLVVRGTEDFERQAIQVARRIGLAVRDRKLVVTDKATVHTILGKTNIGNQHERDSGRGAGH